MIKNLKTRFYTQDGVVKAVNDVSYSMNSGEILGVVGESGCGKSVHALSMMQLIPDPPGKITNGEVWLDGRDLLKLYRRGDAKSPRPGNRHDFPGSNDFSLNPVFTVGFQIIEAIQLHNDMTHDEAAHRAGELLDLVGYSRCCRPP